MLAFFLIWLFISFIYKCYQILFIVPDIYCYHEDLNGYFRCSEETACLPGARYTFPEEDSTNFVYRLDLICDRKYWIYVCETASRLGSIIGAFVYATKASLFGRVAYIPESAQIASISIILFVLIPHA